MLLGLYMRWGRAAVVVAAALLALASCQRGAQQQQQKEPQPPSGRMNLSVAPSSSVSEVTIVSVKLQFWLLASPSFMFYEYQGTGTALQLPCIVQGSSVLNQVIAEVAVQFAGDPATYTQHGSAVFVCHPDADTTVILPFDIIRQGNTVGGTDVGVAFGGSQCSSTAVLRGDGFLAVCGNSSCDAASAAFLFSNACTGLDGAAPDYFVCGTGSDWDMVSSLARTQFAIPMRDGVWTFGLAAVPRQIFAIPDATLTDLQGNRRVFGSIAAPRATLTRAAGVVQPPVLQAGRTASHVALLDAPSSAGVHPQVLLEIADATAGASAIGWTRFGACDAQAKGTASWAGLHPVDVRLSGLSAAKVVFSTVAGGVATSQATCTAGLDATSAPIVTCTAATALGGTP